MKKFILFFSICFIALQTTALPKFGVNKLAKAEQYTDLITTYVDPSGIFQYGVSDSEIILNTKSTVGWVQEKLEIPTSEEMNFTVVGSNSYQTELYLLSTFKGNNAKTSKLFLTTLQATGWTQPEMIKIDGIKKGDPIYGANVSADGKVMILSLDDMRVKGKENLYISFSNDTQWTRPQILGDEINDLASEFAPYLSEDGRQLFFASDRNGGFGMSDIYVSTRLDNSYLNWSPAENMGALVNSNYDETFFAQIDDDQIWMVKSNIEEGALVNSYTSTFFEVQDVQSTPVLVAQEDLKIEAENISIRTEKMIDMPLEALVGASAEKTIYFGLDSEDLTSISKSDLDEILGALRAAPESTLIIIGHTCDLGNEQYNLKLSKKRAISTIQYLVAEGIEMDRLTYNALGESALLSDVERSMNRRVEVKVSSSAVASRQ